MRCLSLAVMIAVFATVGGVQAAQYLYVEEPLAKIYQELDPKSEIIKQVKKGEYLELIYDGESWHKVKIDGRIGWIERRAGKIVDKQGGVSIGSVIFLLLLAGGTLGGVFYYIQKNRVPSMAEVDEV